MIRTRHRSSGCILLFTPARVAEKGRSRGVGDVGGPSRRRRRRRSISCVAWCGCLCGCLCRHVILARLVLVALLAHDVAQRNADQHRNDDGHHDADHDQLVVDAAVRFTCECVCVCDSRDDRDDCVGSVVGFGPFVRTQRETQLYEYRAV